MSKFVALQTGATAQLGVLSCNWQNKSNVKLCYWCGMLLCLTRQVEAEGAGWALEPWQCLEGKGSRLSAFAWALLPSWSASQAEGPHKLLFRCPAGQWLPACNRYHSLVAKLSQMQGEERVTGC